MENKSNMQDEDFEKSLLVYSEVETVPKDKLPALPRTIQQYQERIQANNTSSIFDADYSSNGGSNNSALDGLSSSTASGGTGTANLNKDVGLFKDENVTYVVSGRGRGGRNVFIKPGEPSGRKLNGVDEITQQIRKVAPLGYSNEITEMTVRAHKLARAMEKDSLNSSPTSLQSSPSSPATSKVNSNSTSPLTSKTKTNLSPSLSRQSTPSSTVASDVPSSNYFTSKDQSESTSSSKSIKNEQSLTNAYEKSEEAAISPQQSEPRIDVSKGAIPKKPAPLSIMLKKSREAHKKKQIEQKESLCNEFLNQNYCDADPASQAKIQEILQQDRLEEEMKKKQQSEYSSSSSVGSRDEVLPWRQRNNSPPRYAWGRDKRKEPKTLDINSVEDFPALK